MKQMKLLLLGIVCMMMPTANYADGRMIEANQLPEAARTFVQDQFPGQKIVYAEVEGTLKKTYDVKLADGTEVEFDSKGKWDNVDCKKKAVPAALVPKAIAEYVKTNYEGTVIVKIDKERFGYEIELSNGFDLKFNKKGKFIGMDD